MNYRHAFHAGNFADVFKHALLTRILLYMVQKPAKMMMLDTHAGTGLYDLKSDEAQRSPEWQHGIARIAEADLGAATGLFAPYLKIALQGQSEFHLNVYPGSPYVARDLLRPIDRLVLSELHGLDADTLRENMGRDKRVDVRHANGYASIKALVPPLERRGLIFIDPPFENPDEWDDMIGSVNLALGKWPTGTYALWYPLKNGNEGNALCEALDQTKITKMLLLELQIQPCGAEGKHTRKGLSGCGMVVINPPYVLAQEADLMLPEMAKNLAIGESGWRVEWVKQS